MSALKRIENYAFQIGKQFTIDEVVRYCNVKSSSAYEKINELLKSGKIVQVKICNRKRYFQWNNSRKGVKSSYLSKYKQEDWNFTPDRLKLHQIWQSLDGVKGSEVPLRTGLSATLCHRYINVLYELGLIEIGRKALMFKKEPFILPEHLKTYKDYFRRQNESRTSEIR